jgi:5'-3' exonuclease
LSTAEGKTVVIDTSIYMYKYMTQKALIEYMYLMISILLEYKIMPVFIFDGKSPPEKKELLRERSRNKKEAENKYNALHKEMEKIDTNDDIRKDLIDELESLKKKFIRIKESDITQIKCLMDAYGISYLTADGEADKLCALMVKTGKAWACLSDDMDMFVYGCPRVLRHMSLLKHTIIFYDFENILKELGISETSFREIMVLAGTDYNIRQNISLNDSFKWFHEFSIFNKNYVSFLTFYEWLFDNKKCNFNFDELTKIYGMFHINENNYVNYPITHKAPNYVELKKLLKNDGFISL